MGLCKCPKKKVTNLFCFEHRVNVCEHCLVQTHEKCIVQSYLKWLQDSDYEAVCKICDEPLNIEGQETVRLMCYDVFHWKCLDSYARKMPLTTAPAGYQCPTCKSPIFPNDKAVSPVAEQLKAILSSVNWARNGLGMPLIEEKEISQTPDRPLDNKPVEFQTSTPLPASSVVQTSHAFVRPSLEEGNQSSARKTLETNISIDPTKSLMDSLDHDENKYARRPALTWLKRWLNSRNIYPSRYAKRNRFLMLILIALLLFLTVILFMSMFGRSRADKDPFLDPMANPNIRIEEG